LIIDPNQCKDKNNYYHNFKIQLGVDPGQDPSHELGWSTQVDHSFLPKLNFKKKESKQPCFNKKKFKKITGFLTRVLFQIDWVAG
jgi:hypothetical protein